MAFEFNDPGDASAKLAHETHEWWLEAAEKAGIHVTGFDADAPLDERIAWASEKGLEIGGVYSRSSSKRQHSTGDQVKTCVKRAASMSVYCPPEIVSGDEAQNGHRKGHDD